MPQFNSCLTDSSGNPQNGVPYKEYPNGTGAKVVPFPYQHEDDVNVYIENPTGTYTLQATTAYSFGINSQNENTITLTTSTANPIHIMRRTDVCEMDAQFEPGASVRAQDLNHDFTQLLYLIQENRRALSAISGHDGTLPIDPSSNLLWKRASSTLEPVNAGDNIKVDGTTEFNGVAYSWPSSVPANGRALTANTDGTLSWTEVATGSTNVSSIQAKSGSGLLSGGDGSEDNSQSTGDVFIKADVGDGLAISSNKQIARLDANGGLEFTSGTANEQPIRVKIDGSSLTRDSNGLKVTTPYAEPTVDGTFGRKKAGSTFTWEAINPGDVTGIDGGDGIRIDDPNTATPEVNVDLASDPGLEFNGKKLQVKVPSTGGVEKDSTGLTVRTASLWGNNHDHDNSETIDGTITLGDGSDLVFTENSNTITVAAPGDLGDTYTITWPSNDPPGANQILQTDANGNLSWIATPSGGGGGGQVNGITGGPGINVNTDSPNSAAQPLVQADLDNSGGLTFTGSGNSQELAINANTGCTVNASGLSVDSVTLWGNAHNHSANINGTITLGDGNDLVFTSGGSTGTLQSANLTANRTWTLPDDSGTLATTGNFLWTRVTGTPNLTQLSNAGDTLNIQSGNIRSTTNDLTLNANGAGSNVVINAEGNIQLQDNTAVTGTFSTTGAATLNSATVTNNASVGGTLGVTGATTLSSTLAVTGNTTANGITMASGEINSTSNGDITINPNGTGTIDLDAATTVGGNLTVEASNNLIVANGEIQSSGNNNITINAAGTGTIALQDNTAITGTLSVSGNTDLNGNLDVDGTTELDGLNVDGDATFDNVTIIGTLTQEGDVAIDGDLTIESPHNIILQSGQLQSASNANITLAPNGTGDVVINSGDLEIPSEIKATGGAVNLILTPSAGNDVQINSGNLQVDSGNITTESNANITLTPNGTGDVVVDSGDLEIHSGNITANGGGANQSIVITPNGTGNVQIDTGNLLIDSGNIITPSGVNLTLNPDTAVIHANDDLHMRSRTAVVFEDSDNSHRVSVQAANASATYDITWPAAAPTAATNQVLQSGGDGTLSWVASASLGGSGNWNRLVGHATYGNALETANADDNIKLNGDIFFEDKSDGTDTQFKISNANRGSAGAPVIAFQDGGTNYDTGFYSDANDTINISIAGTEVAMIDAGGINVAATETIRLNVDGTSEFSATSSSGDNPLAIWRSQAASAGSAAGAVKAKFNNFGTLYIGGDLAANTPASPNITLGANGRVLVGIRDGQELGTINGNLQVAGSPANNATVSVGRYSADQSAAFFQLFKSRSNTVGTNTVLEEDDIIGRVAWYAADGTTYDEAGHIACEMDADAANNDTPGRLVFATTPSGASNALQRMRIDNAGRVVIADGGHEAPTSGASNNNLFTVVGDATSQATAASINLWRNNAPNAASLTLGQINFLGEEDTGVVGAAIAAQSDAAWNKSGDSTDHPGRLTFSTTPDGSAVLTERMRINNAGLIQMGATDFAGDGRLVVAGNYSNDNGPGMLVLAKGNDSIGDATEIGLIRANGGKSAERRAADIRFLGDTANWTATSLPSRISFWTTNNGATSPTEAMRIDNAGRVIVANAASTIQGFFNTPNDNPTQFQVQGTNFETSSASIIRNSDNTGAGTLVFGKTRGTSNNSFGLINNGDLIGNISFQGATNNAGASQQRFCEFASIRTEVDANPIADSNKYNSAPGALVFQTAPNQATPSNTPKSPIERMRIKNTGVIHVGTPGGTTSGNNIVLFCGSTNGNYSTIGGQYNDTNTANKSEIRFGVQNNGTGSSFMAFATRSNASPVEAMRINGNRYVQTTQSLGVGVDFNEAAEATGKLNNSQYCYAGIFATIRGNTATTTGTTTDLVTLPDVNGVYLFTIQVLGGGAGNYSATSLISVTGTSARVDTSIYAGSLVAIGTNGTAITGKQTSGAPQQLYWTATRIA